MYLCEVVFAVVFYVWVYLFVWSFTFFVSIYFFMINKSEKRQPFDFLPLHWTSLFDRFGRPSMWRLRLFTEDGGAVFTFLRTELNVCFWYSNVLSVGFISNTRFLYFAMNQKISVSSCWQLSENIHSQRALLSHW